MIEAVRAALKAIFASTFGSEAGNFGYPISQRPSVGMLLTALAVTIVVLPAIRFTTNRIRTHEWRMVVLWLAIGFGAQLALHSLALYRLGNMVESVGSNGFYTVSQQYSARELLSRFHELSGTFPTHARANLPGKILLFEALTQVTSSTQWLGYLIILLSNLGGVLVYLLARQWFKDSITAVYALVLYLFLPARLYFFPLLNTVSPCFMLLVFWFVTRYLESRRYANLVLAGVSLYALVIFEPLPLAAMPMIAAIVLRQISQGDLTWIGAASMAGWIAAAFGVTYFVIRVASGFDLISAFQFALEDARGFNVRANRPYGVWLVYNLKDFFLNMGLAQSLVFFMSVVWMARRVAADWRKALGSMDVVLTIAFLLSLTALDVSGVNRGETVRLWIFLGVLMQLLVARVCATWASPRLFPGVVSISIVQTALCLRMVLWIYLES